MTPEYSGLDKFINIHKIEIQKRTNANGRIILLIKIIKTHPYVARRQI